MSSSIVSVPLLLGKAHRTILTKYYLLPFAIRKRYGKVTQEEVEK